MSSKLSQEYSGSWAEFGPSTFSRAMMHWIAVGFGEEFTYNDWHDGQLMSRALNPETGSQRTICGSIASVSPTEPVVIGLNFARMHACRRVVGYASDLYHTPAIESIPGDEGLWLLDLRTGNRELLLSIADVERVLPWREATGQPRWLNHVAFNTDRARLVFFCRIRQPSRFLDSLWTVNPDGSDLECQLEYGHRISHFAWYSPKHLMISCNALGEMQSVSLTDREGDLRPYADGSLPPDRHKAFSPDFRWVACDTYPEGPEFRRRLLLYDSASRSAAALGSFAHQPAIKGDWRCDLHPPWSRDGPLISFDSAHEGSRQIYEADVADRVEPT